MSKESAEGTAAPAKTEPAPPVRKSSAATPARERPSKGGSYVRQPDGRLTRKDA